MFKRILVALDHSIADSFLLPRVKELARLTGAEIVLLHVSTGWAAQWQENLNLSDSQEIKEDREYLEEVRAELSREKFPVAARHASGAMGNRVSFSSAHWRRLRCLAPILSIRSRSEAPWSATV